MVPPGDADRLIQAVTELLHDNPARAKMGKAARERCLELFTMEKACREYEALFLDLLASGSKQ